MKYETADAFRTALERRLLNQHQTTGMALARLRKLVAFDRFLARLLITAPDRWLLKGALALDYRLGTNFRTTRDIDLSRQDHEAAATEDLLEAQALDLHDHFTFIVEKASGSGNANDGAALRYHLTALVADRPFERLSVDISFGDRWLGQPELLHTPPLLDFAGLAQIDVPAISVEQQIAEKVHAYTRIYVDQRRSSRVKDLIDLVLIQQHLSLNAGRLMEALETTFAERNTHALLTAMPAPPANWGTAYARIATQVDLSPDPMDGFREAARLLDPALSEYLPINARWNPETKMWDA